MERHEKIDYIELPSKDLVRTKQFFSTVFGWEFTDYGPQYTAFSNAGIEGGFFQSDSVALTENGSVLVVFYSENLSKTMRKIENLGGKVIQPIFSFPGGSRFHFTDPNGNEYGVWSDIH